MFAYRPTTRRQFLTVASLWLAMMAASVCPLPASWGMGTNFDERVATWAYWHAADRDHFGNEILKMPGEVSFSVAVALALSAWPPTKWRGAGHLALSGLVGRII